MTDDLVRENIFALLAFNPNDGLDRTSRAFRIAADAVAAGDRLPTLEEAIEISSSEVWQHQVASLLLLQIHCRKPSPLQNRAVEIATKLARSAADQQVRETAATVLGFISTSRR